VCQKARLALGEVAPAPICLSELEAMLAGGRLEEVTLERVSHEIESSVNPPTANTPIW